MRVGRSFFNRDTNIVAQELLGKTIVVRKKDGEKIKAIITETEAYHGFDDKASHASRKKTERNRIMFEKAGLVYVYLVYGMHYCLNFTTMKKGFPAAVLIRSIAVKGMASLSHCLIVNKKEKFSVKNSNGAMEQCGNRKYIEISGPGRVTKFLEISKNFYGEDLTKSKKIWIESVGARFIAPKNIIASKRIGVDYAGECASWKWNYKIVL